MIARSKPVFRLAMISSLIAILAACTVPFPSASAPQSATATPVLPTPTVVPESVSPQISPKDGHGAGVHPGGRVLDGVNERRY